MTTYDLIFNDISEAITHAESVYPELTHRQANYLKRVVSDYLDYAEGEGKQDETTTSPLSERSI